MIRFEPLGHALELLVFIEPAEHLPEAGFLQDAFQHLPVVVDGLTDLFQLIGARPPQPASKEALTNTLKHAAAKNFRLSIVKSYPHIIFSAEDDGVGFDASEFNRHKDTLGLLSMRERASMLGGSFTIRATKGKGTRIRIKIPLDESRHE